MMPLIILSLFLVTTIHAEVILSLGSVHVYGKGIMDITKYSDLDQQVIKAIKLCIDAENFRISECVTLWITSYRPLAFSSIWL